jgi:hypothetical protein
MSDRTLDQLLDAWMDLGPTVAPARVAEAVRLEARSTRQIASLRGWPPRKFPVMNTTVRFALAAAAVVAAAVLGYAYLVAPNVGGPPPADPTPSPSLALTGDLSTARGPLTPGTYVINDVGPFQITITVPSGWERNVIPAMVWSATDEKASVAFFTVDDLFEDVCDEARGWAGIGPTVEDLTQELADLPGIVIDSQADATVSGYAGTLLETSSTDPECADGVDPLLLTSLPGYVDRPHPGDSDDELNRWYILDVDGERLVIQAVVPSGLPEGIRADVEGMVESVRIEVP